MGWIEAILAALGLKLPVVVSSSLGGFVSLNFFEEKDKDGNVVQLTRKKRWTIVGGGALIGMYGAGPLIEWLLIEIPTISEKALFRLEIGLGLFLALFGMSLVAAIIKAVPEIINDIRRRIGGGQ
jgi:pimeloyl-ACP methyl ester carboxylesterase